LALGVRGPYIGPMVIAAKSASQVLLHMAVAFAVMYAFTGSLAFGGIAAIVEPLCNVLLLPLHDRLWRRIARRRARKGLPRLRPEGT
jgi:uncharacterized membrane protein